MKNYIKKPQFLSVLIILSAIIAIILSDCGGGEGNLGINSTPTLLTILNENTKEFY